MADATEEEKSIVPKFRHEIKNLDGLDEEDKSDKHLLRWLRARDLNVDKAVEMVKKSMEWRRLNEINSTLVNFRPPSFYKQTFPYFVTGNDNEGSPIVILPFWDIRQVAETQRSTFIKFKNQLIEKIALNCKSRGITQFIFVVDMAAFAWKHLKSRQAIEVILECVGDFEANYPETLKVALVINSPTIFTILFNLIKPLLTARTLAKVEIYGQNSERWMPILLDKIPRDKLPIKYGGSLANIEDEDGTLSIPNMIQLTFDENEDAAQFVDTISGLEEGEEYLTAHVGAGEKFDAQVETKETGRVLRWHFKTSDKGKDIGFMMHLRKWESSETNVGSIIVPYERHEEFQGTMVCEPGLYIFSFDNTYSRFRSKQIQYLIQFDTPPPVAPGQFQTVDIS